MTGKVLFSASVLSLTPLIAHSAAAKTKYVPHGPAASAFRAAERGGHGRYVAAKGARFRYASYHGYSYTPRLQCVAYARSASGIELRGNAVNWWDAAAGVYQRGASPEPGSVLNFRSTWHMRLGHVAVVTAVDGSREIEIAHANWAGPGASRSGVSRNVHVVDVSAANDWTAVRVSLGAPGAYGSVYPTYGFIYDRPEHGAPTLTASGGAQAMQVDDEVAQAGAPRRHLRSIDLGDGGGVTAPGLR